MHIYVMDADGSNVRQLTNSSTTDTAPVWTPDGRWVVFGAFDLATQKQTLDAVRPDGAARHTVMTGNFLPWVRLSPDGRRVIFTATENDKPAGLYTANMDGSGRQLVPTGLERPWDGIYSPDGKHLVFAEWPPEPDQSRQPIKSDVYIADADGRNRRLLASLAGFIQVPSWSPDGRSIAYQTYTGKKGESDVMVLEVSSGKFSNLSHRRRAYLDETPSWTPDGRLLIQSTRSGRFEVYIMSAEGSEVHALTH
ncbi:MAG: hypothetical protein WCB10_04165 [Steroidobacteraceae bacterium]